MNVVKDKEIYQIIPRKYRPQTFKDIVGQDSIVTTLKNSLRLNRLAHAYLFCGSRGTGKTTLARLFAKALNCSSLTEEGEPCNQCPSCLEVASGRSLDVLEIDGASNRGIDDIRQINETVGYAPAQGKYKIYIIDEVHMLTKEAFNALLKTLEEPPVNVKFFFATTEPHKVLPTIVSRCQRFDLSRISQEAMLLKLRKIAADLNASVDEDALELITKKSEGSLRDAEALLDQVISFAPSPLSVVHVSSVLGLVPAAIFFELDRAIATGNSSFAFELAEQIFSSGKDLSCFLEDLAEHFRQILVIKMHRGPSQLPSSSNLEQYTDSASLYTEEQCLYIIELLIHWLHQISKTPFKRIGLEMILLHLIRSRNRIPVEVLVKRLCELEKSISSKSTDLNSTQIPDARQPWAADAETENKNEESLPCATTNGPADEPRPARNIEPLNDNALEEKLLKALKSKISDSSAQDAPRPPVEKEVNAPLQNTTQTQLFPPDTPPQSVAPPEPLTSRQPEQNIKTNTRPNSTNLQSKYDTIVRFAAVELEGSVLKE